VKRYFFDIVGEGQPSLDYAGQVLSSPRLAYDAAQLMAMDLAVRNENEEAGLVVNVCGADGSRLFSVPVQASYLAAA
jgi:hypothetical protein